MKELEDGYLHVENEGWSEIKRVETDGDTLNFVTRPVTAESVPLKVREGKTESIEE